jgi:two-component system, response regulator PdtaR
MMQRSDGMTSAAQPGAPRLGLAVLVVEDEHLIALDIGETLVEGGCRVIGPAATVAGALALLDQETPDAAVLDLDLRGERVAPVAAALRDRAIPFVLASACSPAELAGRDELQGVENLGKPTDPRRLIATLARFTGR